MHSEAMLPPDYFEEDDSAVDPEVRRLEAMRQIQEDNEKAWNAFVAHAEAEKAAKLDLTVTEWFALPVSQRMDIERKERDWKLRDRQSTYCATKWTPELEDAVMLGRQVCPVCEGSGKYKVLLYGEVTGAFNIQKWSCVCEQLRHKLAILSKPRMLPAKYLSVNIETLTPSPVSRLTVAQQEKELQFLREHRDDSYFFLGKPGTSKTTYATALLRRAVDRDFKPHFWHPDLGARPYHRSDRRIWIWRIEFDTLVLQFQEQATNREAPEPDVSVNKINDAVKRGLRPVLLLEEIDKAKMTEFRANKLFGLVDALYNAKGQLVLTSNLSYAAWTNLFSKSDIEPVRVAGDALMRRINEMCHVRDYFKS